MGITYYSVYKNSTGNVGVGTISPTVPLDVQCDTGGTGIKLRGRSDNSTALRFYANNATTQQAYIGADDSNIDFLSVATRPIRFFVNSLIQYQINQLGVFSWYDGAGGTRMTLNSTGLGIGTTSPNTPLDVVSTSGANALQIRNRSNNDYGFIIFNNYAGSETSIAQIGAYRTGVNQGSLLLYTGTTEKVRINNDGNVGIGTSSPSAKIELYNGNFKISDGNRIIFGASDPQIYGNSGVLTFRTNSSDRMYLDANGNLGIGTSSPLERITFGSSSSIIARSSATDFNSGYCSRILFNEGGTGYGYLGFYTYQGGTGGGERMRITESGNIGIGTGSPDKKLQVIGSLGKGLNLYEVSINLLQAIGTQGKRFEIARVFIDYNDWNLTGPVEIEVRENYYSDGRYKKYIFSYGYSSSNVGSLWLIEDAGRGANDFKAEVGAAVLISGDIYYVPIYIDVDYYQYVDVLVRTNRTRTTNASSTAGGVIYINESPTGSNISSFSPDEVTYLSLASSKTYLGYSGNVGIGTASPAYKLDVNGDGRFIGNIAIITDASTGDYSLIAHKYAGVTKAFSGYNGGMAIYGGETGIPTRIQAGGQYALTALTNGNIGIGTTSPGSLLHVSKAGNSAGGTILMGVVNNSTAKWSYLVSTQYNSSTYPQGFSVIGGVTNSTSNTVVIGGSIYEANPATEIQFYTHTAVSHATGGSLRMVIDTNGNVGIGTTSPAAKLHVSGAYPHIILNNPSAGSGASILFQDNGTAAGFIGHQNATNKLQFSSTNASVAHMTIDSNGNVGIGTTGPASKLDVRKSITSDIALAYFVNDNGTDTRSYIYIGSSPGTDWKIGKDLGSVGNSRFFISDHSNNERLTILTNGNVGIGTTSPGYKLQVNGDIYANGGWLRVSGTSGLYFESYGGGWYMDDATWVRTYSAKSVWTSTGLLGSNGGLTVGYGGSSPTSLGAIIAGNVGIGTYSPYARLHSAVTANGYNPSLTYNSATSVILENWGVQLAMGVDTANSQTFYLQARQSANVSWPMSLNPLGGNVGIGTTSPSQKLEVNGTVLATAFSGPLTGNVTGTATSINGFNNPTTAATVNTIVYRDSGGDIYGRYLFGSYVNSSDDTSSTGLTYIMAKFGDNYHRSASAAKVATFISGQTMDINGSSTSCSGTATTATTANALNTSNSYTVTQLDIAATTPSLYVRNTGTGPSAIRLLAFNNSTYIQSGTSTASTSADLVFSSMGAISEWIRILGSNGNVGIGTASPAYKLDVNGNIHATAFPTSSDIRFKKNITPLENSLEKVKKLQGVKYEWNEFVNSVRDGYKLNVPIIGLIAQDVEKIVPEVIDLWELSEDCKDARSIDYPRLTPLLIEAIKEQQIIIENQNQKIENLIARMSALEAK